MTYHTSREAIEPTVAEIEAEVSKGWPSPPTCPTPIRPRPPWRRSSQRFGRLDALVNMASVFRRTPLPIARPRRLRRDDRRQPRRSLSYGPRRRAADARPAGDDGIKGKIVNVGDWATERPYKDYLPYLVAKGGLTTMTLALAAGAGPAYHRHDGPAGDDRPSARLRRGRQAAVVAPTPLAPVGSAGDVNRLILYLLEGTNFVTGACSGSTEAGSWAAQVNQRRTASFRPIRPRSLLRPMSRPTKDKLKPIEEP